MLSPVDAFRAAGTQQLSMPQLRERYDFTVTTVTGHDAGWEDHGVGVRTLAWCSFGVFSVWPGWVRAGVRGTWRSPWYATDSRWCAGGSPGPATGGASCGYLIARGLVGGLVVLARSQKR